LRVSNQNSDGDDERYSQKRRPSLGSGANGKSAAYLAQSRPLEKRTHILNIDDHFKGRHFDREIIIVCVRWYLRFKLSFRDLVEMMAERGIYLAHTTIMRWIQRYAPEFEKRWDRYACRAGDSWRVDETYVKIKGRWTYLYRAVDKEGKTVDFLLRAKRDIVAAKAFFRQAFKSQGRLPRVITLDGYQASHRAAREILKEHRHDKRTKIRSSKYLNNLIEQDHRSIKLRLGPMLGMKRFRNASIVIAGVELMHRIRKGQFKIGMLRVNGKTAPEIWNAGLAA
jgi:transposase-like protein